MSYSLYLEGVNLGIYRGMVKIAGQHYGVLQQEDNKAKLIDSDWLKSQMTNEPMRIEKTKHEHLDGKEIVRVSQPRIGQYETEIKTAMEENRQQEKPQPTIQTKQKTEQAEEHTKQERNRDVHQGLIKIAEHLRDMLHSAILTKQSMEQERKLLAMQKKEDAIRNFEKQTGLSYIPELNDGG